MGPGGLWPAFLLPVLLLLLLAGPFAPALAPVAASVGRQTRGWVGLCWPLLGLGLGACGGLQGQLLLAAGPGPAVRHLLAARIDWLPLGPRLRSLAAVLQGLHVCNMISFKQAHLARLCIVGSHKQGCSRAVAAQTRDQGSAGVMQAAEPLTL